MEVAGVAGGGVGGMRTSFSLDFKNIRSSIRRQFKKDFYIEPARDPSSLSVDNPETVSGEASSPHRGTLPIARSRPPAMEASTSLQDLDNPHTKTKVEFKPSPTKDSFGEKIVSKVKGFYSSKDDIATNGKEKKKTVKATEDSTSKTTAPVTFINKIKDFYSSMEAVNAKEKSAVTKQRREGSEEPRKGLSLLQKVYSKEERKNSLGGNDPDLVAQAEGYWKGVQFLEKAHTIIIRDFEDEEFINSREEEEEEEEEKHKPPRGWLEHEKPKPGEQRPPPQGRRGRNSIISLNGSIHSLSSVPTAPPPSSERVIRNRKYANTRRGKVARQTFQVYPKSFNQIRKLGLKLSRRIKKSRYSDGVPPVSASQMKDISVLDGVPRSAHNHDVAKVRVVQRGGGR
ncbi:uncharacterized protein LOC127007464 isoform X2 [Eriocheir sinensis]|uniref:uncharacterized protein LOC127007464 isoform X2 n=1 Tax=Eriocheir sinensis TaxID=95602 RepID=UPI0021C8A853|nr:uncharacterized protein LOC127007464 isoform X2 [Eriocheir sinensis]